MILVDLACLFRSTNDQTTYQQVFNIFFPKHFQFFQDNADKMFRNQEIAPYCFSFWFSVVFALGSKIEFGKNSPNGILLFKCSAKILTSFFTFFGEFGNDSNLQNYAKCLKCALKIFAVLLCAKYICFDAFQIYNDSVFVDLIDVIFNTIMKLNLKNLFEYPKLGYSLAEVCFNFYQFHSTIFFSRQNSIILYALKVFECLIFAVNLNMKSLVNFYKLIRDILSYINHNKEDEKKLDLINDHKFNEYIQKLSLEMWQNIFKKDIFENDKNVLVSTILFFGEIPEFIQNTILSSIPDEYIGKYKELFDKISSPPDSVPEYDKLNQIQIIEKDIEAIRQNVLNDFPFILSFCDFFPINWARPCEE